MEPQKLIIKSFILKISLSRWLLRILLPPFLLFTPCLNADSRPDKTRTPNALIQKNWGLKNIESDRALSVTQNPRRIVVAIIDTGIDESHPDLKDHLWRNQNEKINGLDDDGNGLIDDIHGWDFTSNTHILKDNHGHGTHIAGIITGAAPSVQLMILKYYDPNTTPSDNLKNTVLAIEYAIKNGAHIINYSGGGTTPSKAEEAVIHSAQDQGILFVAAAGNERSDADKKGFYPASYPLNNIISVTAIDTHESILNSSNYGRVSVDMAAPGKNIYSTLPNGKYGEMTGTSQATAFVTGAAALLLSSRPDPLSIESIKKYLVETNDAKASLTSKTKYGVRLNSYRSLAMKDSEVNAFGYAVPNFDHESELVFSSDGQIHKNTLNIQSN